MKQPIYTKENYVLYPCNNQFNNKISYWISKKNYTIAFYAFSVEPWEKMPEQYPDTAFDAYITMFDLRLDCQKEENTQ